MLGLLDIVYHAVRENEDHIILWYGPLSFYFSDELIKEMVEKSWPVQLDALFKY